MTERELSPTDSPPPRRGWLARVSVGGWVYVAALAIYLVTWPGQFFEVDPLGRLEVAQSILDRHTIASRPTDEFVTPGRDGRVYSWQFLGQSLLFMSPYLAARTVADLAGLSGHWRDYAIRAGVSLTNPLLAAGIASLVYSILCLLGCSRRAAAATGLLVCFGTVQWWYGVSLQDPTPVVFCLLLMVLLLLRAETAPRPAGWLIAAGAAAGFAVLTRPDCLVALLPAAGFVIATALRRKTQPAVWVAWMTLGAAPLLALMLWHNWIRFGSPLDTGSPHVGRLFNYPELHGLYALLLSPGRSVFLHAPAVFVALLGTGFVARRCPRLLWVTVGAFAGYFLFYAGQAHWQHLKEWVARFTVPGVVLLSLQLGFVLDRLFQETSAAVATAWERRRRQAARGSVVALLILSVLIQFLSVSASTKRAGIFLDVARAQRGAANVDIINDFRYSALYVQVQSCLTVWRSMAEGVPWTKDLSIAETQEGRTAEDQLARGRQFYISQFWWVSLRYLLGGPAWPFLLPPLALLGLFAYAWHRVRRATATGGAATAGRLPTRDSQVPSLTEAWVQPK
jgi:hypothetical protein